MIRRGVMALLLRWFVRLRYPWLFTIAAGLFLLDLVIPDVIPLVDEILLGLVTLLLGSRKDPAAEGAQSRGSGTLPDGTI